VHYRPLRNAMATGCDFVGKCWTILDSLTSAKGSSHGKIFNSSSVRCIHHGKREPRNRWRFLPCRPSLIFEAANQDLGAKSHINLHVLTSAKGTSHEIALDELMVQIKSKVK
jgi:hypothetical protein